MTSHEILTLETSYRYLLYVYPTLHVDLAFAMAECKNYYLQPGDFHWLH